MTEKQQTRRHNALLTIRVRPSELTSISTVLQSYTDFLQHLPALPAGRYVVICYLNTLRLRCTKQWQQLSPLQRSSDEVFSLEVVAHEMIVLGTAVDFYRHLRRINTPHQTRHAVATWKRCTDILEHFMSGAQKGFEA